ncbi:MAG: DEAD/DEAH box helicase family protein [Microscillaceae bacterium]|nr:DEAD/DEAH box helicase family protein [Microscillaceae bacterium]
MDIQFRDFSPEELAFWQEKGKIDPKTLKANRVQAVASFCVQTGETRIREFKDLRFVFAYEIVPQQAYKLYMPKTEHRVYGQAKTVFLPSLAPARIHIHPEYSYAFGLNTLDKNQPALLCAGEPDCLALKAAGYNAFTLGDERSQLPTYVLEKLGWTETQLPARLRILYDTDFTGLQNARRIAHHYGLTRLSLPKLAQQKHRSQPKPAQNDLCDYLQQYGWDEAIQICLSEQRHETQDYVLENIPVIEVKQYLHEQSRLLGAFLEKHPKIQLEAPAGTGKTYTLLTDLPREAQKPLLLAVPFTIQVAQIEQEYARNVPQMVCYGHLQGQNTAEELQGWGPKVGWVTVCTYDRIETVFAQMQATYGDNIIVAIDESHLLTSEYAYRTPAIHRVLQTCAQAKQVILLSATPDYAYCRFHGFRLLRFHRQKNPSITVQPIDYEGEAKQALLTLLSQSRHNLPREKTCVIRLNNKVLAKAIARVLIEMGHYQKAEIDFVFSEKRVGSHTPSKKAIIEKSSIPATVKLLFVTACFDCGINILNQNIGRIISFETQATDHCLDTLQQFVARFRRLSQAELWVCKPARLRQLPPMRPKEQLFARLQKDARNKLALLAFTDEATRLHLERDLWQMQQNGLQTPRTPAYLKQNADISALHKLVRKEGESYAVNYHYIRFALKEYERKNLDSHTFYNWLKKKLPKSTFLNTRLLLADNSPAAQNALKKVMHREKEKRQETYEKIVDVLAQAPEVLLNRVYHDFKEMALRKKIKQHFLIRPKPDLPSWENLLGDAKTTYWEELTVQIAQRYFVLKDFLISADKIISLLKNHGSESRFVLLTKTLTNQYLLLAHDLYPKTWPDRRQKEDAEWLQLLRQEGQTLKEEMPIHPQKKSRDLEEKEKIAQKNLTEAQTEVQHWQQALNTFEINLAHGEKCKTERRAAQRRYQAAQNRQARCQYALTQIQQQKECHIIQAWEINALSEHLNRLRPHKSDWQGPRTNLRLLRSLFEIETEKRLVQIKIKEDEAPRYEEKTLVKIGAALDLPQTLQKLGFSKKEAQAHLAHVHYQMALDAEAFLAKKPSKKKEATIEIQIYSPETRETTSNLPILNAEGYPAVWA